MGSSALCDYLRSYDVVACHGEPFHPDVDSHILYDIRDRLDLELRVMDPAGFVDQLYQMTIGYPVVGFKTMKAHNEVAFAAILRDRNIRKIVLERSNHLAVYASRLLAEKTNIWNDTVPVPEPDKVAFSEPDFELFVADIADTFAMVRRVLDESDQRYLDLRYDARSMNEAGERTIEFLGVNPRKGHRPIALAKLYSNNLLDRFTNPQDVTLTLARRSQMDWTSE